MRVLALISLSDWRRDRRVAAALQYWVQSFHVINGSIRDMFQDVAIEEYNHLENGR